MSSIPRFIPRRLPRRTLLRGAGVALGLPFLEAMAPRRGRAETAPPPRRFGVFFSPCGTIPESWRSLGSERDFTLSRILEPLSPLQRKLVVLRGVNVGSAEIDIYNRRDLPVPNAHDLGMTHMLTATPARIGPSGAGRDDHFLDGSAGGISIDQAIARGIGAESALTSLELGVECNQTFLEPLLTRMSYRGPFLPMPPIDDPVKAYLRLFGSPEASPALRRAELSRRRSVLDHVMEEYTALDRKLGAGDRARLEQYLTDLRSVEIRLGRLLEAPERAACGSTDALALVKPSLHACLRDQELRTPELIRAQGQNFCVGNFVEVGTVQMDLLALAFGCDLTRVASLQWSTAESTVRHEGWVPLQFSGTTEHHYLTHNETLGATAILGELSPSEVNLVREDLVQIHRWYAEQFHYLLSKLDAMPEGENSVLDNSLIFWCNELGEGGRHSYTNVPYVLAGGLGGRLPTGRYLDYLGDAEPSFAGPSNNHLFESFFRLFDLDPTGFGDPDFSGELSGLV